MPRSASNRHPVVLLQHDADFGPGYLTSALGDFGIPTSVVKLHDGGAVPDDLDEIRMLISLGGNARVDDGGFDEELAALEKFVDADRPVIGIGLGAQLLAKAAGAEVMENRTQGDDPQPAPVAGWTPIKLPFPGGTDPIMFGLHDGARFFSFHRDTFTLPKLPPPPGYDPDKPGPPPPTGNLLLASTPHCKNAAFRFKTSAYGFQFHFELTPVDIEAILITNAETIPAHTTIDELRSDTKVHADRAETLARRLIENIVQYRRVYD
ncbi:MAG: type 1 glutamine amidotransferase [Planctomycetota bacterium]